MKVADIETEKIIDNLPTAILRWYPFETGKRVLFLGKEGPVSAMLRCTFGLHVITTSIEQIENFKAVFDYAICIGELERHDKSVEILSTKNQKYFET